VTSSPPPAPSPDAAAAAAAAAVEQAAPEPSADGDVALLLPLQAEQTLRRRALFVGVALLVSIGIFAGALLLAGPLRLVSGPRLRVDFAFAGPIKPGASVRLSGVVVGVVEDVELLAGRDAVAGPDKMVRVHVRVTDAAAPVLTDEARFLVTTLGVLGEHYLDVVPPPGGAGRGAPLADGARVDGTSLARADLLLPRAAALLETADAFLPTSPEARALLTHLGGLLARLDTLLAGTDDAALREEAKEGLAEARALAADVRALVRGAAVGVGDGTALKRTLDRLPPVLDKTVALEDQLLAAELPATLSELRGLVGQSQRLLGVLDKGPAGDAAVQQQTLAELRQTLKSLDAAAGRADRLLGQVEGRAGAAGKLWHDEAFADDLRGLVKQLRDDPLKLLWR
jgi:ABC-type transporter Mla subunit MlaD